MVYHMSLPTFWIVLFPDLDFPSVESYNYIVLLKFFALSDVHIVQENSDFHPPGSQVRL